MIIKKLNLTNFRGIASQNLAFRPHINVLSGINGAGKSSVLEALAILLSRLIGRICSTEGTGRFFSESDIRNGFRETVAKIEISYSGKEIDWQVSKATKISQQQTITNLKALKGLAAEVRKSLQDKRDTSLPVAVFYSVNRSVIDVPLRIRTKHTFDQITAYDLALTGKRNDFRLFFEWFRDREDYENEMIRDNKRFVDPQLKAVREAIEAFTGFTGLRIHRNPLRMEVVKNGKKYDVRQMSDGEKCHLALIGDLARRLAIANPGLRKALEGTGVVLIDEIDLHLHPTWQAMVIPQFTKVFPNCQFVVSSHSPHVLTHVKPESVFLFRQTEDGIVFSKASESYGQTADRILEDLMGLPTTRPKEVAERLSKIFELIGRGEVKKAKKEISGLKEEIGVDPELVKADVLIKRKEIIGR
jgi:predicted ATP-binding protein involved in virulence